MAVAGTICSKIWNCSACVVNDCLFLISEDESSGCYRSIVGRPQVKKQLKTVQDCKIWMGNVTISGDSVDNFSNDLVEILGSGTVGILIGVLVTLAVCCYFLQRQRLQRQGQDPEMAEQDDNGGFRVGGNYSPRTVWRAIGHGLRAGAMVSRVVQQFTRRRQNDHDPLVPNEQVEHPDGLEPPRQRNQREEIGRGRRGRANNRPRNILRVGPAGIRVAATVSQIGRRLYQIVRQQNERDYVDRHVIEGFENIALGNLARDEQRPPAPDQDQFGPGADRANEPPQIEPEQDAPVVDDAAEGVEDDNNEDASSTSTDSTLVPEENDDDLIFYDALSDATESRDVSSEPSAENSSHEVEENDEEDSEETDSEDQSEAGSSFSIGSSESTSSRRIQPTRTAKTESNEMIKALRKHKLI